MHADLILYAVLAAVMLLWLKNVIGTQQGSEKKRPNPYTKKAGDKAPQKKTTERNTEDNIASIHPSLKNAQSHPMVDNKTAEAGLTQISLADSAFNIEHFIQGSKGAFEMIVTAFASGQKDVLKDLLAKPVYKAFESAINEREARGETAETKIIAIKRTKIIEAKLNENEARITVQLTASETHVTRDKDGNVIYGHATKKNDFTDIWVFARDVKSKDPKWLLVETRDDIEEDYDKTQIPDAK